MQDRTEFIGGSDAVRIVDGDLHSLWMEKTGRKIPADLSDVLPVQLGIFTEPFNVQLFARKKQVEVSEQEVFNMMWNGVPCRGTLDGVFTEYGQRIGLECKHTNQTTNMTKQLDRYMPQLQFYMQISAISSMYLSCIFGNQKHDYVKIDADQEYQELLIKHIQHFWECVTTDTAPSHDLPAEMPSIDHIKINDMVARDANTDNQFVSLAHEYIETKEAADRNATAAKDLKSLVADNEREVHCNTLTVKRDKRGAKRIYITS